MVNQICIASLDMKQVLGVISKGAAQSWQMESRGATMVDSKFDFGFAVDWMCKDLGLCLAEAKRNGARLPVTAIVDQFYADVQNNGGKRFDTSSLITWLK
ncbi:MAG: NAD-binding protein [Candidatus Protistobacter heckmanni]|nr:NAD-binding protein [Candidatus Protistobacter heckmanni]